METRRERIPSALAGERVDRVVALLTGLSRAEVAELVEAGAVRVGSATVRGRSRRLSAGEILEVDVADEDTRAGVEADKGVVVPVVYVDDEVVVVDKPAGLVVHPGAGQTSHTMVSGLLARFPEMAGIGDPERPGLVHRLDKGTSGLLVVARTAAAYASLVAQLKARTVAREYEALVWGSVDEPAGWIDAPVGRSARTPTRMAVTGAGRPARTGYTVLERYPSPAVTRLLCRLETGRTHQIRVHLAAIGHPIVGDARYGGSRPGLAATRPFLHARTLRFRHPSTDEEVAFEAPLPADLDAVLAGLGGPL